MVGIYLNPGNRMFQRELDDLFYVDKTGLASFMNARIGLPRAFVAVSRPRRFGKSYDADMLCAYYSRGCEIQIQIQRDGRHERGDCHDRHPYTPLPTGLVLDASSYGFAAMAGPFRPSLFVVCTRMSRMEIPATCGHVQCSNTSPAL